MQIRVLLTAPVIRSGVFTHVCDLTHQLGRLGAEPFLAVVSRDQASEMFCRQHAGCPYDYFDSARELVSLARNRRISLIHAHSPLTLDASFEAAKKMSLPLVITLHGKLDWAARHPNSLKYAAHIIAVGAETARLAGAEYQKKITVIYNGINLKRFQPKVVPGADTGPLRVLYFGRTSGPDARGFAALDKAVKFIRNQSSVDARLVGRAAGVFAGSFYQCGWLDEPLPVLQWGQVAFGRGRSLREAMACGNVGCLLGEGYGGVLTQERMENNWPSLSGKIKLGANAADADTIAKDLIKVEQDRYLLQNLRKEAHEIAVQYFDARKMAEETVDVYRTAMGF